MCVAQLVDFKSTGRKGKSRPGGWRGRRILQCPKQTANKRSYDSYLKAIGPRAEHSKHFSALSARWISELVG